MVIIPFVPMMCCVVCFVFVFCICLCLFWYIWFVSICSWSMLCCVWFVYSTFLHSYILLYVFMHALCLVLFCVVFDVFVVNCDMFTVICCLLFCPQPVHRSCSPCVYHVLSPQVVFIMFLFLCLLICLLFICVYVVSLDGSIVLFSFFVGMCSLLMLSVFWIWL